MEGQAAAAAGAAGAGAAGAGAAAAAGAGAAATEAGAAAAAAAAEAGAAAAACWGAEAAGEAGGHRAAAARGVTVLRAWGHQLHHRGSCATAVRCAGRCVRVPVALPPSQSSDYSSCNAATTATASRGTEAAGAVRGQHAATSSLLTTSTDTPTCSSLASAPDLLAPPTHCRQSGRGVQAECPLQSKPPTLPRCPLPAPLRRPSAALVAAPPSCGRAGLSSMMRLLQAELP